MKNVNRSLLLIVLAAVFWGTAGICAKYLISIYPLSPLTIGAWRLLIASPILLFIAQIMLKGKETIHSKHFVLFFIYGFAVAAYQITYFSAVNFTMVSTATLIAICTSPIFVAVLSKIFINESLTRQLFMALTLSIVGTVMIIDLSSISFRLNSQSLLGYTLAIGAGLSYATYAFTGKRLVAFYSPLRIVSIAFTLGALFMLPFAQISFDLPMQAWGILLYLGIMPTAFAYIIFTIGLKRTTATKAAIASLLEPLTSTILAVVFIGEQLNLLQSLGAVLMLTSLVIISTKK